MFLLLEQGWPFSGVGFERNIHTTFGDFKKLRTLPLSLIWLMSIHFSLYSHGGWLWWKLMLFWQFDGKNSKECSFLKIAWNVYSKYEAGKSNPGYLKLSFLLHIHFVHVCPLFLRFWHLKMCMKEQCFIYVNWHVLKEHCEARMCISSFQKKSKNISALEIFILLKPSSNLLCPSYLSRSIQIYSIAPWLKDVNNKKK